ncbi:MAG: CPBP family intramembrane glutamic endopeptidase [Rhodoglobus sp.]
MLDPAWALTRPILWIALVALVVLVVVRTVRKDRKEYERFKRYRMTSRRQAMFRKWLRDSFVTLGVVSIALLWLAGGFVAPLLAEVAGWPVVRDIRGFVTDQPGVTWGVIVGLVVGFTVLTVIGVVAARKEDHVLTVGDIAAMLPRNRQELRLGALLSMNAGVVEELMFRLALPAVIYGASGSAIAAVAGSLLLFGTLHLYQGIAGIVSTTIVGAIMMLLYVVSGTIVVPIVLHALFDLRSLVLIPMAVNGVHRIDGVPNPTAARTAPTSAA